MIKAGGGRDPVINVLSGKNHHVAKWSCISCTQINPDLESTDQFFDTSQYFTNYLNNLT